MKRRASVIIGAAVLGASFFVSGADTRVTAALSSVSDALRPASVSFARVDMRGAPGTSAQGEVAIETPRATHVEMPTAVKGIYMSQCAAATPSFRRDLISLITSTELNAIIIDLKDYSGTVAFPSETALEGGAGCTVPDFEEFVEELHRHGIFVIGRLTVFQDPLYTKVHPEAAVRRAGDTSAVWKDHKGLSFVDVGAKQFWDYIVALAREAHALGVDEINFDYIRYPSDGNMRDVHYVHSTGDKQVELERFFAYLAERVRENQPHHMPVLSADLFGMTTTNYDDLNIGQVLERALPYFDYIAPMVYPSHYPSGFRGYANVNAHAYDIVYHSMKTAAERAGATTTKAAGLTHTPIMETVTVPASGTAATTTRQEPTGLYAKRAYKAEVMRPWLQDFNYPVPYTPEMVAAQIQATYDAGLTSWMFWDPANTYTSLRQVLKPE